MKDKFFTLDLAALLCSRVCHDVVGPLGAISNGLEILEDEKDPEMRKIAEELVQKSTQQAIAKLTFSRIAFGASSTTNTDMNLEDVKETAEEFMQHEKANLIWNLPNKTISKNEVKLLLNLLLIGISAIPRGGTITIYCEDNNQFQLLCDGPNARIPSQSQFFDSPVGTLENIDAHSIQPIYTALLAEICAIKIMFELKQEAIHIIAQ